MKFYNIKKKNQLVNFIQSINQGIGENNGLFFPNFLPKLPLNKINKLLELNFIDRSTYILSLYIGNVISKEDIFKCVKFAFTFTPTVVQITDNIAILELFHGPTLSFKDFGCRLMAQFLNLVNKNCEKITIITATSGDTGAAVANAFYGFKNVKVVILYPYKKITLLQEKLFCTLGKNIYTIAINGSFDDCQRLVKESFKNNDLKNNLKLNSANSINICRLLAQICYYFEGISQLSKNFKKKIVISVPSGNFGNLTAGLIAKSLGLKIKRFIAATNINNTVFRYLNNGLWEPKITIPTLSNAMDVSNPSNWCRIEEFFLRKNYDIKDIIYCNYLNDLKTIKSINELAKLNYISEPHAAIAYHALFNNLNSEEFGLFLGTAHPSKFKESVENITSQKILLPYKFEQCMKLPILSKHMEIEFSDLKNFLLKI